MKLTNRLLTIAAMVPKGATVADIGTDHAYIPVFLVKNGISKKVIASDINKGPLEKARKHIVDNKLEGFIETRLGAGLKVLQKGEVDTIIIAGMGGVLIKNILEESKDVLDTVKTLILQPMKGQEVVRKWLNKNNFKIVKEILARETNKFYEIIVAQHGYEVIEDEIYFEIGKKLIENKDPLLKDYLRLKIGKIEKVLENLKGENTQKAAKRKIECQNKLNKYYSLLNSGN